MRHIVSDTGPVLHLREAQALDLLKLTGVVHVPKTVEIEIKRYDSSWFNPDWIIVDVLIEPYAAKATSWQQAGLLDPGEAEAKEWQLNMLPTQSCSQTEFGNKIGEVI